MAFGATPTLGSLILFSARLDEAAAFYRCLGVPLEREQHDDGPDHYAADLGTVHVALYASSRGDAPRWEEGGSTWPGFVVGDFDATLKRLIAIGAPLLSGPEERPWGTRVVVADPDGRPIEVWVPAATNTAP